MALIAPTIAGIDHQSSESASWKADRPLTTITQEARHALVGATLVQTGYGERVGQEPRVPGLNKPLGTVVACGVKHALVAGTLVECAHGEQDATGKKRGAGVVDLGSPMNTVLASNNVAVVASFLAKHFGGHETPGWPVDKPISTVTAKDHHSLITVNLMRQFGNSKGAPVSDPMGTVMPGGGGKTAIVTSNIVKLRGDNVGHASDEPLHTRFALVTIRGALWAIIDIGLRMLQPRELFRAQGFPDSYIIDRGVIIDALTGALEWIILSKSDQVRMCGNSVCPPLAAALVEANVPEMSAWEPGERRKLRA